MAKLYFRYGAMNCGKTASLLQVVHNYEELHKIVILMKPSLDTKGGHKVTSRTGLSRDVDISIHSGESIIELLKDKAYDAIIVDEAQFLEPEQIDELYKITKVLDRPVLCYGLRCDFKMEGFPGSTRLLQIADTIEEIKSICSCGKKATQNMRLINGTPIFEGNQTVIDDKTNISYKGVCGECFLKNREKTTHENRF